MTTCYLGLGSNLQSPKRQLQMSIKHIRSLPRTAISKISTIYLSEPWGIQAQPLYCNMVIEIKTTLHPLKLLDYCKRIEKKMHRQPNLRYGARILDIDILLYGQMTFNHRQLMIPHPSMKTRDFVLIPLLEISPMLKLPNNDCLSDYLTNCQIFIRYPKRHRDPSDGRELLWEKKI